jgi:hypothetical protein
MTGQSTGALIHNRGTHEQQFTKRERNGPCLGPEFSAERLVMAASPFDQSHGVGQRRTGQFHTNLHWDSMAHGQHHA